tara:strand:+ start:419 stop:1117 length:699 start_codon:yes stop_codon:yes gene_type:complete
VLAEIRAAGGEVFGITSEPQTLASEAESHWETGFPLIGDPHHEIRQDCLNRDWVDVFYNTDHGHLRERKWASHPKGYYQPAVVAAHKTARVLYRWRCVPKFSNMSGAGARPEARYTWEKISAALGESTDAAPDVDPIMGSETLNWPRFLLLLSAHGWFIRPRAFPLRREGDPDLAKPADMRKRIYGFGVFWLLLFLVLPIGWFTAALATFIAVATPGHIEIHRQFQNKPNPH